MKTHCKSGSRVYNTWVEMLRRCNNPDRPAYKHYGGRGIKVCNRWLTFEDFYIDMGDKPAGMTLDRIDNDGNYEPSNCRWSTWKEQARNRRNNRLLEYNGIVKTAAEWSEEFGINHTTLHSRLGRGWTVKRALTTPPKEQLYGKGKSMFIDYGGMTRTVAEWCDVLKMRKGVLLHRLNRGWSVERAIATPTRKYRKI